MTIFKAGADAGNNGLKLWVKDVAPIAIPTIYSLYMGETTELMDMEDIPAEELINNIDLTIDSKALSFNGQRYVIGEKVLNDNLRAVELEKKSDKSKDEIPVIVTLAGLAIDAMKKQYDKDNIKVTYDLSVALPVSTITQANAKANSERFMGTHEVTFHHPSGRNVKVTIKIEYCKCLPEGAAAAWGVVFDETGKTIERKIEVADKIMKVDFQNKTLLHFDIGAGTTEIVVTEGIKFNPKLSEGLNYGVKQTILEIIKRWNRKHPRKSIDSMAEFNEIYFDTEHPRHNDLKQESQTGMLQLAQQISSAIIDKIDDLKDDPYVFIYGGGAAVLKDYLQKILDTKGRTTNVTFLSEPMFVNARGLLVYTCSPRYEQQKETELGVAANGTKS
ncbi:ParM/StbA family protein [Bacillus sp. UMB0893]|uniref:ParM/StbA family protein n=1 Tax=Bacillus sp. UMB0893 TaxID=2066053 RepID=UPI0008A892F5|nr:ParM/StbA family protein [Bacillus sp. UMB0893]OHR74070.1 peptide ABC transporter substrate-binding protein [Bacillus sp. HMSC76G11]PLR65632.1 peptide ABC transporter substrate-binding protein [Bacillus sp. UMB0893]